MRNGLYRLLALGAALLAGCAEMPSSSFDASALPPLQYDGNVVVAEDVPAMVPDVDLLEIDDDMRAFVDEFTDGVHNQRARLLALHTAVKSPAALDLQYDPFADGSARDAFRRGSANCLAYANLFVALAREAGLDARYQWMDIRPEWQRLGDRVVVRLHVNVLVKTKTSNEYMVDIDPLRRHEVAGSRVLRDREAKALHYGNIAMQLLADGDVELAWANAVKSLELSSTQSHLWVNLGAIYRYAEQYTEAEQSYFRALSVDRSDRSAMNNLVVLYSVTDRPEEEAFWVGRLRNYRERNPYYHSNLGDVAGDDGDWDAAFEHYTRAVELRPEDSELVYALGVIEHQRGNYDEAAGWVEMAIEKANFETDQANYRVQLRAIEEARAASL